ncbi:BAG family molecular chaperone regulator 2-like [Lotus japonicus]|uniref:BAG family molecular chaperone regulator 2-like n=1 Tax=Lotus japonicus TaxID=34305 RepID=UPI0025829720|nr:BAG family molecular chaperone regulator 2-like [Lotus japonicus]
MMVRLRSMRFSRSSSSKLRNGNKATPQTEKDCRSNSETKWEIRPGGMLVQKREISNQISGDGMITIIVSTVSESHDISIEATSTFGELKMILSLVTSLEPREQRLLFKGKERDNDEYLHMVGVRNKDKVLLLKDPALKELRV